MPPAAAPGVGVTAESPPDSLAGTTEDGGTATPDGRPSERWWWPEWGRARSLLVPVALLALLGVPLLVALAALRQPRWYPVLDMAQTELRVRDVSSANPPLIGLAGRIGKLGEQGSHPGPFSFWALWPTYRILGATSWAMQAGAVVLHLLAMGTALWIARRRGGVALVLGVAAVLALLVRAYGANTLTEAWNPYLPLLWWFVFLLAVWSVLCGDLRLLPVMVGAGSFCAQTHIPYLGLTVGLGVVMVIAVLVGARANRRAPPPRPRLARWMMVAVGVGILLWLPPVIDQFTNSPGNISKLADYFADPTERAIGPRGGIRLLLVHLDPWQLLAAEQTGLSEPVAQRWPSTGSVVPGGLVLAAWVAAAVAAWRLRHTALLRLHAVVAAAMVLGVVVLSRIFGYVWYYLSLWAGGIAALLFLSLGWTVAVLLRRRLDARTGERWATAGAFGLVGVTVLATALFAVAATDARSPDPRISRTIGELVPPTVEALEGGTGGSAGRDGRYLVTWADPVNIGAAGFGLLLELERQGFDVGVVEPSSESSTAHRVLDPDDATAVVHLAVGQEADRFRGKPGVRQVALVEPRSAEEQEEYARVRAEVIGDLEDAGLADLAAGFDRNVFLTATTDGVPRPIRDRMQRLIDLGLPNAVLVGPPAAFGR